MEFMDKKLLLIVPFSEDAPIATLLYHKYYKEYQNYGGKPVDEEWALKLYQAEELAKQPYMARLGLAMGMGAQCDGFLVCNDVVNDRFTRDVQLMAETGGWPVYKI